MKIPHLLNQAIQHRRKPKTIYHFNNHMGGVLSPFFKYFFMITVFDNTPENDPNYMQQRIREMENELVKRQEKIHELKAYVFWHRNQEDKWKTKHDVLKIRFKELEGKLKLLTGNDN